MTSNDINNRSELNRRINADLRARAQNMSERDDPEYDDNASSETRRTGRFGWVWIVLIALAIISLACIVFI